MRQAQPLEIRAISFCIVLHGFNGGRFFDASPCCRFFRRCSSNFLRIGFLVFAAVDASFQQKIRRCLFMKPPKQESREQSSFDDRQRNCARLQLLCRIFLAQLIEGFPSRFFFGFHDFPAPSPCILPDASFKGIAAHGIRFKVAVDASAKIGFANIRLRNAHVCHGFKRFLIGFSELRLDFCHGSFVALLKGDLRIGKAHVARSRLFGKNPFEVRCRFFLAVCQCRIAAVSEERRSHLPCAIALTLHLVQDGAFDAPNDGQELRLASCCAKISFLYGLHTTSPSTRQRGSP